MQWYLKVVRDNYANFDGRARRMEYWMFELINLILIVALGIVWAIVSAVTRSAGLSILFIALYCLYALAMIIPSLAVSVRRMHDTGRSGWWLLINFVPFIGGIWFLVLTILDGDPGNNAYGPSPKAAPVVGPVANTPGLGAR